MLIQHNQTISLADQLIMAKEVGFKCSLPNCGHDALPPSFSDAIPDINTGVAIPLTGKGPSNSIWLCQYDAQFLERKLDFHQPTGLMELKHERIKALAEEYTSTYQVNSDELHEFEINILRVYCETLPLSFLKNLANGCSKGFVSESFKPALQAIVDLSTNPDMLIHKSNLILNIINLSDAAFHLLKGNYNSLSELEHFVGVITKNMELLQEVYKQYKIPNFAIEI